MDERLETPSGGVRVQGGWGALTVGRSGRLMVRPRSGEQPAIATEGEELVITNAGVLELGLPEGCSLTIVDRQGAVEIRDGSQVTAQNVTGTVTIRGCQGTVTVEGGDGSVQLLNVGGAVDIRSRSGDVKGGGIGRRVSLADISGTVRLNDIAGSCNLERIAGNAQVHDVAGDVAVADAGAGLRLGADHRWGDYRIAVDYLSRRVAHAAYTKKSGEAAARSRCDMSGGDVLRRGRFLPTLRHAQGDNFATSKL